MAEELQNSDQEAADREKRQQLLDMGIGDLTPESLEEMRRNRFCEGADGERERPPGDSLS